MDRFFNSLSDSSAGVPPAAVRYLPPESPAAPTQRWRRGRQERADFTARISGLAMSGGLEKRSLALAKSALAIPPFRWALRPFSSAKVSKMPYFPGPSLIAYQLRVAASRSASGCAIKLGPGKYGIFDTFADENGRNAHLNGEIAKALFAKANELLASPPKIDKPEILASIGGR